MVEDLLVLTNSEHADLTGSSSLDDLARLGLMSRIQAASNVLVPHGVRAFRVVKCRRAHEVDLIVSDPQQWFVDVYGRRPDLVH